MSFEWQRQKSLVKIVVLEKYEKTLYLLSVYMTELKDPNSDKHPF